MVNGMLHLIYKWRDNKAIKWHATCLQCDVAVTNRQKLYWGQACTACWSGMTTEKEEIYRHIKLL